jgi:ribosomal protein S18 acetylase RimI-like enzyme
MPIETIRETIQRDGIASLVIDDLVVDDLPRISWSGSPGHLRNVADKLRRTSTGELDYLVVRTSEGTPVAKAAVDYDTREDAGEINQLATMSELQGLGIATFLIHAAEERIRRRGLRWAVMGVEVGHDRAASLYARLGYDEFDQEDASWETTDAVGNPMTHEAVVTLMRKALR